MVRRSEHRRHAARVRWLRWGVAVAGALWLGGISFWLAGLIDRVNTDLYQAGHHYRLEKSVVLAGIEISAWSWIWVDEDGMPYAHEPPNHKARYRSFLAGLAAHNSRKGRASRPCHAISRERRTLRLTVA